VQPRHASEAEHLERPDPRPGVHRRGRADGRARPQGRAPAQEHLSPVRRQGRDRVDEHAHAGGRRGDVRSGRHHSARPDRGEGHGRGSATATPGGGRELGGAVPQAHGRRRGARAGRGAGPVKQPSLRHVLQPKWRTALQRVREERARGGSGKLLILGVVGLAFWTGVYGVLYRILKYFRGVEDLGPLLAGKLLGLVLLSFMSILVLSNVVTALSSFFLARDLDLLVSSPVDWLRLYLAKLGETLLHSSWMVALTAIPILTAYGVIYHGGWLFAPYAVLTIVPLLVLPAVLGTAITLVLVNLFPARRTRDLLSVIALGAAGGVVLLFRLVRPERLARPEGFRNLLDFITVLRTPTSPFLPSEWAAKAIMGFLRHSFDPLPLLLLWTTAAAFVTLGALLHRGLFATGYSKAQGGTERCVRGPFWRWTVGALLQPL